VAATDRVGYSAAMLLSLLFLAFADPSVPASPDAARVCTAEGRVAVDPALRGRIRGLSSCANLVTSEAIANYLKAFAVRTRELTDPAIAAQLLSTVEARWLLVRDGSAYQVFDAETGAFVDPALFAAGPAETQKETPAETAYRLGYQALRGKRYDEAKTQLSTCLSHDADHVGCHWELGWVHWVAEDWAAAEASWTAVEQRDPDYPDLGTWLPKAKAKAGSLP